MLTSKQVTPIPTSPLGTPTRAVGTSPMALLLARTSTRASSILPVTPSFPEETINGLGGLAPLPVSSKGTLECLVGLSHSHHSSFIIDSSFQRDNYADLGMYACSTLYSCLYSTINNLTLLSTYIGHENFRKKCTILSMS